MASTQYHIQQALYSYYGRSCFCSSYLAPYGLDGGIVSNRVERDRGVALSGDDVSSDGESGLTTKLNGLALGSSLSTLHLVGLHTVQEVLTALGVLDMLDTDVDALLHVTVANNLVNQDTDRGLSDVVDDTSLTVVVLVGHTLLDSTIDLDVDNVADLVGLQVRGQTDLTMLSVSTLEKVARTSSDTVGVRHVAGGGCEQVPS